MLKTTKLPNMLVFMKNKDDSKVVWFNIGDKDSKLSYY